MKKVGKVWAYKKSYTIFLNHVHVTQTYNDFFLWSHLLSFNWYDRWHLNSWFWYFSSYVWYSCAWNFVVWLYIGIHTNKKDYTLINFYIYANVCLFILNMNNNKAMEKCFYLPGHSFFINNYTEKMSLFLMSDLFM